MKLMPKPLSAIDPLSTDRGITWPWNDSRRLEGKVAGELVLTVSHDKTARLRELLGRRMLSVLRLPIGEGDEGKLYAGTLSPDGRLAAAGGYANAAENQPGSQLSSIHLFDTSETGGITMRL